MALRHVRLVLDDIARHPERREDAELQDDAVRAFNGALRGLAPLASFTLEKASRTCDIDMEDSRRWQSSIEVTCVIGFDPDLFDASFLKDKGLYEKWPEHAASLETVLGLLAAKLKEPDMRRARFSKRWIVGERADLPEHGPEAGAAPGT